MDVTEQRGRSPFWFFTGNIKVLVFCRLIWSFSTSIVYPFFSLYIIALGGTPAQIGLINSLGLLAGMFLYPLGGYIADRMGRVKLIGYTTYIYAICHLPFIFAANWQMIALGQFLTQLFLFYTPAMNALQADSLPPGVRGRGFATIRVIPGAVRIIAPIVGGWIILSYGGGDAGLIEAVRLCWGIAFLTGLLVATIRLKFLKETVQEDESGERLTLGQLPRIVREAYGEILGSIKWMDSSLRGIVIVEIISALFIAGTAPFWVVYATNVIGLEKIEWGSALSISGLLSILLAFPLGSLVDRFGSRKMILLSMGLAPLIIPLFIYAGGFNGVTLVLCALSLINGLLMPAFSTLIANSIPKNRRGRLYSLLGERGVMISYGNFWGGGFLLFPAAALGSFIGGYVYEFNGAWSWIILAVAMGLNFVLAYIYIKEPDRAQT